MVKLCLKLFHAINFPCSNVIQINNEFEDFVEVSADFTLSETKKGLTVSILKDPT